MTRIVVSLLVILAGSRAAHAGWDCPDNEAESIRGIEAYARNPKVAAEPDFFCANGVAKKFAARVAKACTKIIDRKDSMTDACVDLAAFAGLDQVGDHDIFHIIAARSENALDYPGGFWWERLTFLGEMSDPRAVPIIVQQWKDTSPRAAKRHSDNAVTSWVMWRRDAAHVLGDLGGQDEIAFLEEQAAAAGKSKVVKDACEEAIVKIWKRLGVM